MQRDLEMVIKLPKELEKDLRLFVVLHGGSIVSCVDTSTPEEKEVKDV